MRFKNKVIDKILAITNSQKVLVALIIFDFLYAILNIFKQTFVGGILFLLINCCFITFCSKKNGFYVIFALYPLARVLKFPGIGTSLYTVLLLFFLLNLIGKDTIKRERLSSEAIMVLMLFSLYVVFSAAISFINKNDSLRVLSLISYYSYLSLPILSFVSIKTRSEIDGVNNILFCVGGYLYGMMVTIIIYNFLPNGINILKNAGVIIFEMGIGGTRLSPLTDDPNYGTSLIIILAGIFLLSQKNVRQKIVGYPLLIISLLLSLSSLSKMYILEILILGTAAILKIMLRTKSSIINALIIITFAFSILIFVSTSIGSSLLVRLIGIDDGVDLSRITSGRTDIFGEYSSYIFYNPSVLLFGKGPIYMDLDYFSAGEHNSFTKLIFGNGIIGTTILICILITLSKYKFSPVKDTKKNIYFIPFLFCLFICAMSLGMPTSTVFPVCLTIWQFSIFEKGNKTIPFRSITI